MYVSVSLGGHNLDTFYARKFGMLLTKTQPFNCMLDLPRVMLWGRARGQNVQQIRHWKIGVVTIWPKDGGIRILWTEV